MCDKCCHCPFTAMWEKIEKKAQAQEEKLQKSRQYVSEKLEQHKKCVKFMIQAVKLNPIAFLLTAVPALILLVAAFKTPANNMLFSVLVFVDLLIIGRFVGAKVYPMFVEKVVAKEAEDECYDKLIEKLAVIKTIVPCDKCCCSCENKDPKKMLIFVGFMMIITLVAYLIPLRYVAMILYITIVGGIILKKLSENKLVMDQCKRLFNAAKAQILVKTKKQEVQEEPVVADDKKND